MSDVDKIHEMPAVDFDPYALREKVPFRSATSGFGRR